MAVTVAEKGTPATTVEGALTCRVAWEEVPQLSDASAGMEAERGKQSQTNFLMQIEMKISDGINEICACVGRSLPKAAKRQYAKALQHCL
jgi:hypothetical protein